MTLLLFVGTAARELAGSCADRRFSFESDYRSAGGTNEFSRVCLTAFLRREDKRVPAADSAAAVGPPDSCSACWSSAIFLEYQR